MGVGNFLDPKHEKAASFFFNKILDKEKGCFIDVGVHIGETLLQVKILEEDRQYLGFEPNPRCYYYTDRLVEMNNFKDTTIMPIGLSYESKLLKMFAKSKTSSAATVVENFRSGDRHGEGWEREVFFVPVFDGDSCVTNVGLSDVSIIKIDVEGAELDVIKGLRNTLKEYRPYILCEILPVYTLKEKGGRFRKERQDKLISRLKEMGYLMFRLLDTKKLERIRKSPVHSDLSKCEYVFAPEENLDFIEEKFECI